MITIKTFGKLTELTGNHEIKIMPVRDTDSLKATLYQQFPELADMQFFIAINNKMVQDNTEFDEDAIIALLPPFSGG